MTQSIEKKTIQIQIGVAIAVILSIIATAFALGTQTAEIKSQIREMQVGDTHIIQNIKEDQARISALEKQNQELEIELASIKTKLAAIDLGIQEIKFEIHEHNKAVASGLTK